MKTIKIIEILNKIANNEELPYIIKYNERIYEYVEEIKWYLRDDLIKADLVEKINEKEENNNDTN